MATYDKTKLYWFKFYRDFFRKPEIQYIKSLPGGRDYILFYLELMAESVITGGYLTFENIPYDETLLAVITGEDINVVKGALFYFEKLGFIERTTNGFFMTEIPKLAGVQSIGAAKKQEQRTQNRGQLCGYVDNSASCQGGQTGGHLSTKKNTPLEYQNVTGVDKCPPEIELELDIDIEERKNCLTDSKKERADSAADDTDETRFFISSFKMHIDDIQDSTSKNRLDGLVYELTGLKNIQINGALHRTAEIISILLWYCSPKNSEYLKTLFEMIDDRVKAGGIDSETRYTVATLYNYARMKGANTEIRRA